jgi:hypothetical protein
MTNGFEGPQELPDEEKIEDQESKTEYDEGDFVVDENGFGSLEQALRKIREMGNGEILDEAA